MTRMTYISVRRTRIVREVLVVLVSETVSIRKDRGRFEGGTGS